MRWRASIAVGLVRAGTAIAVAASVAYDPSGARASEPGGAPGEPMPSPRVEVHLVGRLATDSALGPLLQEWLGSHDIDFVLLRQRDLHIADVRAPREAGPPVRMWIVAANDREVRVYFSEPDTGRYLFREVPLPSGFDEVGRERVVQVVLSSALAFIEDRASSPLEEVERALAEPHPVPTDPSRHHPSPADRSRHEVDAPPLSSRTRWTTGISLEASYGLLAYGRAGLAHGAGAILGLTHTHERITASTFLMAEYRLPREVAADRVRLGLRELAIGSGFGAELELTRAWAYRAALGLGVTLVEVHPTAESSDVIAADRYLHRRASLFVGMGPSWRSGPIAISAIARLEATPRGVRYELRGQDQVAPELVIPRLHPGTLVTLSWHRSISRRRATP